MRYRDAVRFPAGSLIFLRPTASRATLVSIQPTAVCAVCVSRSVSPGVEWLGDGFDISFTSSGEAKIVCGSTSGPFLRFHGMVVN